MSSFNFPHGWDAIGDAIGAAMDPAKPDTPARAVQLLMENNRAAEDAISNLGKTGTYELRTISAVAADDPKLVLFTPEGNGAFLTSVRVWASIGAPNDSTISCALNGDSGGTDRGFRHDYMEGNALAVSDVGVTISNVEASFGFYWHPLSPLPVPDPLDFLVEIISAPL